MNSKRLRDLLTEKGLKITPQRVSIFEAIHLVGNHPTAETIINFIKKNNPNISVGTVYKVLDVLVENNLLSKVKTENGIMRYDPHIAKHHHLYCTESNRIEDYRDETLDAIIQEYFKKKKIKNFKIQDVKLQMTGEFINNLK